MKTGIKIYLQNLRRVEKINLSLTETKVYHSWYSDASMYSACPSTLEERLGIARRHCASALRSLVEKGIIEKTGTRIVKTNGGLQEMNFYELTPDWSNLDTNDVKGDSLEDQPRLAKYIPKASLLEGAIQININRTNLTEQINSGESEVLFIKEEAAASPKKPSSLLDLVKRKQLEVTTSISFESEVSDSILDTPNYIGNG